MHIPWGKKPSKSRAGVEQYLNYAWRLHMQTIPDMELWNITLSYLHIIRQFLFNNIQGNNYLL